MTNNINEKLNVLKDAIKNKSSKNLISLCDGLTVKDVEKLDEQTGLNLIHLAVSENAQKELFLLLVQFKNADVNILTNSIQKKSALEIACSKGNKEIVKLLLQNGAKVEDMKVFQKKFKEHKSILTMIEEALGFERKKGILSFFSN